MVTRSHRVMGFGVVFQVVQGKTKVVPVYLKDEALALSVKVRRKRRG
jgi:hypothetical protein